MNKTVIKTLIAAWALMCAVGVYGADSITVKSPIVNRIGVDLRSGWVPPTNSYIRGENHLRQCITTTSAVHFRYDMSFTDATRLGRLFPGAYQGVGVGINTFYKKDLLSCPTSLYVYQGAPIVHFSRRLWLGYEWNFGASFGWKKYDKDENEQNLVIGSSVNAYIDISFLLHYRLTSRWQLIGGVEGAHYSNGNTSWPNAGVNSVGARIGVSYLIGREGDNYSKYKAASGDELEQYDAPAWNYDVVAYGAARKRVVTCGIGPSLVPGRFGVAGVQFAPMRRLCRYFRAGLSADIQYDESSDLSSHWVSGTYDDDIKFIRPGFFRQVSVGLSARAELNMPIFSVNVGFGRNLIGSADSRKFYQLLALKTFVTRNLFLHTGYQLSNFKDPNNLMLGIGYRFH